MKLELKENQSALVIEHDEQGMVSVEVFSGGTMDDIHSQLCEAISEKWEGKEYWNELMEIVKTKKQFANFLLVGLSSTVLSYLIFIVMMNLVK